MPQRTDFSPMSAMRALEDLDTRALRKNYLDGRLVSADIALRHQTAFYRDKTKNPLSHCEEDRENRQKNLFFQIEI
ncbi:hypothetical protein NPIL_5761 [Nephila pilipes]|uniref:Uncharacterized protein n=1 Tax=Nephila pilipes TaxID=299642 RepID=A0A8X6PFZ0_NEPPI|nr:hypothetical protein NPIL_5761 [Nephila pilipes]